MKLFFLVCKNLLRNKLRTVLTALAVGGLAALFTMIITVLLFLDEAMEEKSKNVKLVITERHRIPSCFDRSLLDQIVAPGHPLHYELQHIPGFHWERYNVWHYVGLALDRERKDKNLQFFAIATIPERISTLVDGLEGFDPELRLCSLMKRPPRSCLPNIGMLMGRERMAKLHKKVGDVFNATALSHREGRGGRRPLELEFEIVGELPAERGWGMNAFMDYAYLDRVLKENQSELDGKVHLGWLMVENQEATTKVAALVERNTTDLKCETQAAGLARHLAPYQDLLRGVRFILVPALVIVMTVIVANSISITTRERTDEMAILKVLGFRRSHLLLFVLGEVLLVGSLAGLGGGALTYWLINMRGGIKIALGFFPVFWVPAHACWWGMLLGAFTALLGGFLPAWNASAVRVSETFSRAA